MSLSVISEQDIEHTIKM